MEDDLKYEWYTKYVNIYGGGWAAFAEATDGTGRIHKKNLTEHGLHLTENDARRDGVNSGYPERKLSVFLKKS